MNEDTIKSYYQLGVRDYMNGRISLRDLLLHVSTELAFAYEQGRQYAKLRGLKVTYTVQPNRLKQYEF